MPRLLFPEFSIYAISGLARFPGWPLRSLPRLWLGLLFLALLAMGHGRSQSNAGGSKSDMPGPVSYLGFDKNDYPGDGRLEALRRTFAFTGYWLNTPPGASGNPWTGKRAILRARGFGFLLLFNGRLDAALKSGSPGQLGRDDAAAAIAAAAREGFPPGATIFLDQEEGGRLLPEQAEYVLAWVDAVRASRYKPGVYCSGIAVPDGAAKISTAQDILTRLQASHQAGRVPLWVAQDECPPAPGCVVLRRPPAAAESGVPAALVWQYTQSPRRSQFTRECAKTYAPDGGCYAPGLPRSPESSLDLDVSPLPDPSSGR